MRFFQASSTSKTVSTNETITRSETTETCHAHFPHNTSARYPVSQVSQRQRRLTSLFKRTPNIF